MTRHPHPLPGNGGTLARASAFYDAALAPLGVARVWSHPEAVGCGLPGRDEKLAVKQRPGVHAPARGLHLAFTARSRDALDAFHQAALAHGGRDDGAPGLRPAYGSGCHAAFVTDPDGHHLEAVCHEDEPAERALQSRAVACYPAFVSRSVPELFDAALALDEADRAKLAAKLVESLDGETDPDAGDGWAAEIEIRLAKIDAGEAKPLSMAEAVARLHRAARGR